MASGDLYPSLQDFLARNQPAQPAQPVVQAQPAGMPAPPPTGTGNLVSSALGSGFYGAGAQLGGAVQAGATLVGADNVAKQAADFAARQRATAATYATPENENASVFSPRGLAYRVLQGAPAAVGALGGALVGGMVAPEAAAGGLIGAGLASFPFAVGSNVETSEAANRPLTRNQAATAIGLGVPEAAIGAAPFHLLGGGIARQAAAQAAASAAQDFISQQMGDPNRQMQSRMQEMISSAVTGGVTGALMGAGVHALAKINPSIPINDPNAAKAMADAVDTQLGVKEPPVEAPPQPEQVPAQVEPEDTRPVFTPGQRRAGWEDAQAAQDAAAADAQREVSTPSERRAAWDEAQKIKDYWEGQAYPPAEPVVEPTPAEQPEAAGTVREAQPLEAPPTPSPEVAPAVDPAIEAAVRAKWEESGPTKENRALAEQAGMLDENGALKPADTQSRINENDTQTRIEPNRPPIDAVEPKYQPLYQKLEDLHSQVSDPADTKALEDAQTGLALRKTGDVQQARVTADKISAAIAGDKARADLAPAPAKAQSDLVARKAEQQRHDDHMAFKLRNMTREDINAQIDAETAANKEARTATTPKNVADLQAAVETAKKSMVALAKIKPSDTDNAVTDKHVTAEWKQGLLQQTLKLKAIDDAIKSGDTATLAKVAQNDEHFANDDLWANGKFNDKANAALDAHADLEEAAMAKLRLVAGQGFWGRDAGAPNTAGDARVTQVLDNGGSAKDVFADMARNGSTGEVKTLANIMARKGVDAQVQFSPRDEKSFPGVNNDTFGPAYAKYDPAGNRIHLFQPANLEQAMLHEGAHAATSRALEANTPAATEMKQLYAQVKDISPDKGAYGLNDVHEFVADAFSNPQFRSTLAGITAPAEKVSLWQKFKNAVGSIFGVQGTAKNMLDRVIETGGRVMDENRNAPGSASPGFFGRDTSEPEGANEATKAVADRADAFGKWVSDRYAGLKVGTQKAANFWGGSRDIATAHEKLLPSGVRLVDAQDAKENQNNAWNKHGATVSDKIDSLSKPDRGNFNIVAKASIAKVDGRVPWKEQPNKDLFTATNRDELEKLSNEANRAWNLMSPEGREVYKSAVDYNQGRLLGTKLLAFDNAMKAKFPDLTEGFEDKPGANFQIDAEGHDDLAVAKQHLLAGINKRVAGAEKYVTEAKSTGKEKEIDKVASIEYWLRDLKGVKDALPGVPYFKAGRGRGAYFVAGEIGDKPNAIDKIGAKMRAAGFNEFALEHSNENRQMYARFETREQAEDFAAMLGELQKDGALSDKEIAKGPVSDGGMYGANRSVMNDIIASLRSAKPSMDGVSPEEAARLNGAWEQSINDAVSDVMDMTPDSAVSKVFANRENVHLFSEDMAQSLKDSVPNTSRMLAELGTVSDRGAAQSGIRNELKALNSNSKIPIAESEKAQNAAKELSLRAARSPVSQPSGFVSGVQRVTTGMEIGTSVPYVTALTSQHFTWSLPRLGSVVGMTRAATAMAQATKPAFIAMNAMRQASRHEALAAGIRLKTLTDGGLNKSDAEFLTRIDNKGGVMQNAYTHQMAPSAEGDGLVAKAANWTTVLQRYAEAWPRIQMLLAAKRAWREGKDGDLDDFALKMVKDSQQNWGASSTPRALSAGGFFGPAGPLINTFMGYRVRVMNTLIHQVHEAISAENPTDRAAAGKFLAYHIAATTVVAGAMGLPMVAVFASVYDKVADELTGSPNHDIMGSFRNYLDHVYGKEVGQAIARGVPTLAGIDLNRLGEQKLLPGSDMVMLLTGKKRIEDSEKDWLKNMAGPSVGLGMEFALGMRDISNGDYLNGAVRMAPEALRGPVEAVRDALYGYRDKGGTPIGITLNGIDIALTAMGFEPTKKATSDLNRGVVSGLQQRQQYESSNIEQHLAKALQTGNHQDFQYWLGQSQQYQQTWPGMRPPAADLPRYMQQHMQMGAFAAASGLPFGIKPKAMRAFGGMFDPGQQ